MFIYVNIDLKMLTTNVIIDLLNQLRIDLGGYCMQSYHIPLPAVGFHPPVYICRRATKSFALDGRIDKEFWEDAPFTRPFIDIKGEQMPLPRHVTQAKMLWDNENLYFAAKLAGNEIWATVTERDDVIFRDNDFELFIDPDSDTHQYYEFEMNAMNTVWDLFITKAYRDGGKAVNDFDIKGLQTAVYIDGTLNDPSASNSFWSVEIVIPFRAVYECANTQRTPIDGEYYRINFSRVQWLVDIVNQTYKKRINPATDNAFPEDNWVWAPTGVINIHYPELWSFVFFADGTKEDSAYVIPEDEKIKWELRKLYYAQNALYDQTKRFSTDMNELVSMLEKLSPCEENKTILPLQYELEATKHTFEISCPSADHKHTHIIFSDGKTVLI